MKNDLSDAVVRKFCSVAGKYQSLQETPLVLGDGTSVYGSELHLAVAIGTGSATTATGLSAIFGVTKGAISQSLKKLEGKGLIRREFQDGNGKTRFLSLTTRGRELLVLHERLHGKNRPLFEALLARYSEERLRSVLGFLDDVGQLIDALGTDGDALPSVPTAAGRGANG